MDSERDRMGAVLGLLGVLGNVVGVAALGGVEGAYRPAGLGAWAQSAPAHPGASAASAVAFTIGLLALAGWAAALGRSLSGPAGRLATGAMVAGAVINAAGTLTPAVLVLHVAPACGDAASCAPVARALLGLTLSLDALFNLAFGAGLALAGLLLWRDGRRVLGGLGVAAGLATVPVAGQLAWEGAAAWLAVAGPLWLAFVAAASAVLWRGGTRRGAAREALGGAGAAS